MQTLKIGKKDSFPLPLLLIKPRSDKSPIPASCFPLPCDSTLLASFDHKKHQDGIFKLERREREQHAKRSDEENNFFPTYPFLNYSNGSNWAKISCLFTICRVRNWVLAMILENWLQRARDDGARSKEMTRVLGITMWNLKEKIRHRVWRKRDFIVLKDNKRVGFGPTIFS